MSTEAGAYDDTFKVVLVGDHFVGKSSLLLRYCDDSYTESPKSTVGLNFKIHHLQLDGRKVKLQIWDFGSDERLRTITSAYYRGASCVLLVYDITNERTFARVKEQWLSTVEERACPDVYKVLIGAKADDEEHRQVSTAAAQQFADSLGIPLFETSAKEDSNIDEAFATVARELVARKKLQAAVVEESSLWDRLLQWFGWSGGSEADSSGEGDGGSGGGGGGGSVAVEGEERGEEGEG
eukprot:PLAT8595.2.p1 GENE.PLAT8595.2~~PLAT8595.2.p1  ORF type:complete len:238 (-),score=76.44 PLAT8595.2:271-984(-)